MHPHRTAFATLMGTLLVLFHSGGATACAVYKRQDFKIFQTAEVILRAKIIDYHADSKKYRAVFVFKTVEVLLGRVKPVPETWAAVWTNSTFGEPKSWTDASDVIVGLSAKIDLDGNPVVFVVQQSCSSPSIIPYSQEKVRAVLDGAGIYGGSDHSLR